jgi:glycine cleavage system H protein
VAASRSTVKRPVFLKIEPKIAFYKDFTMNNVPNSLKYTASHEWILDNGDGTVTVGITDHAQELLGDVVFVELPEVGRDVSKGEEFSLVESVKAASDIYAPLSGEVIEVNESLVDAPETLNESAYEAGWIAKLKLTDVAELQDLLDADAYQATVAE